MLRLLDPWCIRLVPLRNLDNIWSKAVVSGNLNHPVLLSESDFIGGGQRVCISNKFQGGAHASAPGTTRGEPLYMQVQAGKPEAGGRLAPQAPGLLPTPAWLSPGACGEPFQPGLAPARA